MLFKPFLVSLLVNILLVSGAGAFCKYGAPHQAMKAREDVLLAKARSLPDHCVPEGISMMKQVVSMEYQAIERLRLARADKNCHVGVGHVSEESVIAQLNNVISECRSKQASAKARPTPVQPGATTRSGSNEPTRGSVSPRSMTGSSSPMATRPSKRTAHLWSGQKADCDSASQLERNTAAWYDVCVPSAGSTTSSYVPSIPPQTLTTRAKLACGGAATPGCMIAAKVKILMKEDPSVRRGCATARRQDECVNRVYLYGPDGSDVADLRRRLIAALNKSLLDGGRPAEGPTADDTPPTGCPAGQGMKPTPGGFGSWSCQPLTKGYAASNFERDVAEIAADVVANAATRVDPPLSPLLRTRCAPEVVRAIRSVFTGGAPAVRAACRPWSGAARDELRRLAGAHLKTYSPDVETIFSGLKKRDRARKKTA